MTSRLEIEQIQNSGVIGAGMYLMGVPLLWPCISKGLHFTGMHLVGSIS
jgi:hypothetical protein